MAAAAEAAAGLPWWRRSVDCRAQPDADPTAAPWVDDPLRVEALLCVCTAELLPEIESWLATAARWHPAARFYLAGDYPACHEFLRLAVRWDIAHRVYPLPLLAGSGLDLARARCGSVARHSAYWREDVIWWKIAALEWVLTHAEPDRGVLLTDSDVVFAQPVTETWGSEVDAVLSPFWWWAYDTPKTVDGSVTLPGFDGFFNAGYLLTRRAAVAREWLALYESGAGGFYEQKALEFLPRRFACDYFSARHNWGKWRREAPRGDTVSLHYHLADHPSLGSPPWLWATKRAAEAAAAEAVAWWDRARQNGA